MSIKDKLNIATIDIDLSSKSVYPKEKIKSLDTKSRYKHFRFFDNGLMLSLNNITVRAYMIKPDKKVIFNDLIKIDDNIVELEFTNQALVSPGILQIELVLYEDDAELSSFLLEFEIIKSIRNSDVIESTNEFNSLQIVLRDIEQIKNSFTGLYNEKETMLNNLYNNKETMLNGLYNDKRNELDSLKNKKEQELDNTNKSWSHQFEDKYNNLNSEYAQDLTNIYEKVNVNTANIANNTNELNKIKDSVVNNKPIVITDDTPIGTIVWYSSNQMSQIDTDIWKWCNGQTLNKNDYPEAYSVLRPIYGGTDTTFNLPDLMQDNLFIRAALENGTNTGHSQLDTIKSHNSTLVNTIGEATMISNIGATHPTNTAHTIVINNGSLVTNHMPSGIDYNTNPNNRHLIAEASYTGATETRPKNVSMIPLIKIKSRSKDMISVAQEWEKFKSTDASLDTYYGYQKLPSGLIIQWGTVWLPDTNQRYSQKDFSFPVAFPNECLGVFADGARNNNAWFDLNATAVDLNLNSCRVMCAHINPGSILSGQTKVYWFAIGR